MDSSVINKGISTLEDVQHQENRAVPLDRLPNPCAPTDAGGTRWGSINRGRRSRVRQQSEVLVQGMLGFNQGFLRDSVKGRVQRVIRLGSILHAREGSTVNILPRRAGTLALRAQPVTLRLPEELRFKAGHMIGPETGCGVSAATAQFWHPVQSQSKTLEG